MMSSEVVEEASEGIDGVAAREAEEAKGTAAKEPNQCSNCFMSRVTLDMVA
jgi:hypothetical protein